MPHYYSIGELDTQAKALGAVKKMTNRIVVPFYTNSQSHSEHYFNEHGEEVAYFLYDQLVCGLGLYVLNEPRHWFPQWLRNSTFVGL